ncbi:MAG: uracil-DNA glycosylase [Burkholderiales bacterium]|nr:uracil-DNA glycosylase [Burkholderiales bacterium]
MGLGPVWRLRRRDAGGPRAEAAEATEAPQTTEAPEAVEPAAPEPAHRVQAGATRSRGAGVQARAAALETDPRAAAIARMDWEELKASAAACSACGLCKGRTQAVFGVGDEAAPWMVVGEAPGAEEDARGEPFVGQAGRLLDAMLAAIGLARGRGVYIGNVIKCRPPGNRNPEPQEVARCAPYLARQIELVRPRVILALGRFAAQALLSSDATIASLRGRVLRYRGIPTIVSYHPAYLLRNLPDKSKAWEDLCLARRTLAEAAQGSGPAAD